MLSRSYYPITMSSDAGGLPCVSLDLDNNGYRHFFNIIMFFKTNFCCSFFRITLNNFLLNLHFLYLVWILCSRISGSLYCGRVNFVCLFFRILFFRACLHILYLFLWNVSLVVRENVSYSIMLHGD